MINNIKDVLKDMKLTTKIKIFMEKQVEYAAMLKLWIENCSNYRYMDQNKKLKNTHKNERCFIFGNGPSIQELDFSNFENEFVFTVNQIARNPNFAKLKTNIHFWVDTQFFNLDLTKPENIELFNVMKNVNTKDNTPMCFFPIKFRQYIISSGLATFVDANYFFNSYGLEYFMKRKNNYCKMIPGFSTVIQYAIFLANYMGFSEVYLLGCETTSILTSIKVRMHLELNDTYAYEISENEKKRMKSLRETLPFSQELRAFYRAMLDYENLDLYCSSHGTKIYNCTPFTLIDCIERRDIDDVFHKQRNSQIQ